MNRQHRREFPHPSPNQKEFPDLSSQLLALEFVAANILPPEFLALGGRDNLPQVVRVAQRQEALGDRTIPRVDLPCPYPLVPTAHGQPMRLSVPPLI